VGFGARGPRPFVLPCSCDFVSHDHVSPVHEKSLSPPFSELSFRDICLSFPLLFCVRLRVIVVFWVVVRNFSGGNAFLSPSKR